MEPRTDREWRLAFLGLTEKDAELLRALRPLFLESIPAIEDAFYDHLLASPATAQLLRDQTTVVRLKKMQSDYLLRITEGNFDEDYFANRQAVGRAHERVGLNPRWYLLAYNTYFRLFAAVISRHFAQEPGQVEASLVALQKVFMLDASLAMDAYIASDRYRHLQQLESIINDSGDIIFSLDSDNRFRSWNRAAEQVFGWTTEEILGKHLSILVPPELAKAGELARIDKEIREHGQFHVETIRRTKDGRDVPVDVTVSALRDPQGQAIGRSAILRDITERKRLQEENLRAERLAVVGTMSARLAHEIRNPLSSITLNIDLVRDEIETLTRTNPDTGRESRDLLRSLSSEVHRIQRVTEDYLKFARLPKLQRETIYLNEMLEQQLGFMATLFQATRIDVRVDLAPDLPAISADDSQLWQAILNLIRNAIEAMPNGGALTVRTERRPAHIQLSITDTGKGISEAEREQLFKPFFSTKVGGTGLGLPLTQQIITEHGGSIRCESAPGQGTTFVIDLPQR